MGWPATTQLLEGSAGIGLALLAAATPVEPAWDRMMLASVAPPRKGAATQARSASEGERNPLAGASGLYAMTDNQRVSSLGKRPLARASGLYGLAEIPGVSGLGAVTDNPAHTELLPRGCLHR